MRSNSSFTGDTLVAVADGRVSVSFKELSEQKVDVPVYCLCEDTGKIDIKTMRMPRCIGINYPIYKITMFNNFAIYCTPNTKLRLSDGKLIQCHNLKFHDKLWLETDYNKFNQISDGNEVNLSCFRENNKKYVHKICEYCGKSFVTLYSTRNTPFCSNKCHIDMQQKNKVQKLNIKSTDFLYVESIEFKNLYNDIYSGNVDIAHNFFIYNNELKQYINVNSK